MTDLTSALIAAGQADKEAERYLENLLNQDYAQLVVLLSQEIADASKPFPARQMACLYMKNTLAARSPTIQQEKHERWKTLDAGIRKKCKDNLMVALRDVGDLQLPHFVAVAAAEIAVVELPYREWPEFVAIIMNNTSGQTLAHEKIKIASLECLGYACDRIVDVEDMVGTMPSLDPSLVDQMLTTIVNAVQPDKPDDLRFSALQALKNALLFVKKNMDAKAERDFIMNAIFQACRNPQSRIRSLAFSCLDSVSEFYYEVLQDYMPNIYQLTTDIIREDPDETVKGAAIEVWNTLAEQEYTLLEEEKDAKEMGAPLDRNPCPCYVLAAMETLVPLLLNLLTSQNEDDEDDAMSMQDKAATCLDLISVTVQGRIVPTVMPYVTQHIQSQEWRYRDAAIVAFMCILDGPSTADIGQYVDQSIQVMLSSFNDDHSIVRGSAVHCVRKICSTHLSSLPHDHILAILQSVDEKLKDRPSIVAAACSAIYEICQNIKEVSPPPTNVLSGCLVQLMQDLLQVTDRHDSSDHNIRVVAMSAASAVVQASAADVQHIFGELLPAIVARLEASLALQVVSSEDRETRAQLVGQLCGLIQTLYQRMEKNAVLSQTDRVMNLLLQALSAREASEEAFSAIGSVSTNLEQDFVKYMETFLPMLLDGLRTMELTAVCQISVGVVVDLCGALGPQIQPYADVIMEALFNIIRDSSVHRDVKPSVISCFGDMAMAIGAAYQPYMQLTMMLLMQAAQQQAPPDNEDMVAFINQLRCSVLEAYSGILVGLAEAGSLGIFAPNLSNILSFLSYLASDGSKDEAVLHKSVTLLGDIAHELGSQPEVKQQINQAFVGQLVREAISSHNDNIRSDAQWAANVMERAISSSA